MRRHGLLFEAPDGRSRFLVEPGQVVLAGRRPPLSPLNVRIPHAFASRHHFRVVGSADGTYLIEDAGSSGGFYIDDRPSPDRAIGPGVRLSLGLWAVWVTRTYTGHSLSTLMHAGPVPISEALTMAHAVLQQLAPLHAAKGLHGGLTPHEVLRDDDGRYVVLIRHFTQLQHGVVMGDPRYGAPELLELQVLPASDVFAVGLLVYELLTGGRHPYSEVSVVQNLMAKGSGADLPWEPDWPEGLRKWLSRVLWFEPRGRSTVAEALARLDALDAELSPRLRRRRDG